jgi:GNAT superfamily N-acetyltransferase
MSPRVRILETSDVPQALALSRAVGWNQTPADWALVIEMNAAGCFALECDGQVIATTSTIRYGTELAWVGMVLTHPEFRGRGYARTLMERALDHLSGVATVKLDATEVGRPLYKKLGFVDECAIERWIRPALPSAPVAAGVFTPQPKLDKQAFGADRRALLHRLAQFEAASVVGQDGILRRVDNPLGRIETEGRRFPTGAQAASLPHTAAFAMGRADRFGPCVSRSRDVAEQLAQWFLARHPNEELLWDLFPENNLAESLGFALSRRLTRMTRGRALTGDNSLIYAGAGFEFG